MGTGVYYYGPDCSGKRYYIHTLCRWRRMRRAAHEALSKTVLQGYHSIQTKEATILVSSLLSPSSGLHPDKQFYRLTTSLIMSILYDHPTITSEHDETIKDVEAYNVRISHAAAPGANLVDIFPCMIHIPERFSLLFSRYLIVYTDAR